MQHALLEFEFFDTAERACTASDIEMGYQIFLGRNPENATVVEEAMTSSVSDFIRALAISEEFDNEVLLALADDRPLPHTRDAPSPSAAQKDWLLRHLLVPPRSEQLLRAQADWADWIAILVALPGFPILPSATGKFTMPLAKRTK